MSVHYRSDKTGLDIADGDLKTLTFRIQVDSSALKEPKEYQNSWHLTSAEFTTLKPAWNTLTADIKSAVLTFIAAVET